jgi:hypothetical protein
VGVLLAMITMQARFKRGDSSLERGSRNYRTPQAEGFAELAANMRRDRQPVIQITPTVPEQAPRTQRIVIEGTKETRQLYFDQTPLPRYYSNKDDAQAASTFKTMKMQALVAKPIADGFGEEANRSSNTGAQGISSRGTTQANSGTLQPQVMESAMMAAFAQQGDVQPDPNGQAQKQNFLRGSNGGGSMHPKTTRPTCPSPSSSPMNSRPERSSQGCS